MGELRLVGGVLRVLVVVGAVFDVAVLNAGAASADGPVQLKSDWAMFAWTPRVGAGSARW